MDNVKELYIFGEPVDTELGQLHFLTLREYPLLLQFSGYITMQKFEVVDFLKSINLEEDKFNYLSQLSFVDLIKKLQYDIELYRMYKALFLLCFKKDVFDNIVTDEQFDYYRDLIKEMNNVSATPKNPNPEIERFNTYKRIHDKKKGNDIDLESIITSVWSLGINPFNLTIYQVYALFNRMIALKNYDASIVGSAFGGKLEHWFKPMGKSNDEEKSLEDFEKDLNSYNLNKNI